MLANEMSSHHHPRPEASSSTPANKMQKIDPEAAAPAAATLYDVDLWLSTCMCDAGDPTLIPWLADSLTADYAFVTVLDAVFSRGRYCRPATRSFPTRALDLLTAWLGMSTAESLQQLAAQRIAMILFQEAAELVDDWYKDRENAQKDRRSAREETQSREGLCREFVMYACGCGNDDPLVPAVLDELYVFLIVYELFIDLRTLKWEPGFKSDLRLPVASKIRGDGEWSYWWYETGQYVIEETVPWKGRGLLAKIGLLPHALIKSLSLANSPKEGEWPDYTPVWPEYITNSYGYTSLWRNVVERIDSHQLGLQASLHSIEALTAFLKFDGDIDESQKSDIVGDILPKLMSCLKCLSPTTVSSSASNRLPEFIETAKTMADITRRRRRAHHILCQAAEKPLKSIPDSAACLAMCIDNIENWITEILKDQGAYL